MVSKTVSPAITCIIPTYNRAALLKEAVTSIIYQTFTDWELIIVDNGSTDNTPEIINEFLKIDKRIRYYLCTKKGPAAARNFGVSKAWGQFIAFLDDDDISLPNRFNSQTEAIRKSGKEFVVSGYEVRERYDNKLIVRVINELKGFGAGFPSRWIISKSLFNKCKGFDEELLTMEDPEFSYRVAQHEIFAYHAEVVTIMYHSHDSISSKGKTLEGKEKMMEKSGHLMHPVEAAWWYSVIAIDCNLKNDFTNALKYLRIAAETDRKIRLWFAYYFAKVFLKSGRPLIIIINKILKFLGQFRFPILVEHSFVGQAKQGTPLKNY